MERHDPISIPKQITPHLPLKKYNSYKKYTHNEGYMHIIFTCIFDGMLQILEQTKNTHLHFSG